MSATKHVPSLPVIDCAESKYTIAHELLKRTPKSFSRYHQPFFGSGALFTELSPDDAYLSDIDRERILAYRMIRDRPHEVYRAYLLHVDSEPYYKALCKINPEKLNYVERAARYLYLSSVSVPSYFKYNPVLHYSMTYCGQPYSPKLSENDLIELSTKLNKPGILLEHSSFELLVEKVDTNDFVYLDPPHLPIGQDPKKAVTPDGFTFKDYECLRDLVFKVKNMGCHVMVTCPSFPEVKELFTGLHFNEVEWMHPHSFARVPTIIPQSELIIRSYV